MRRVKENPARIELHDEYVLSTYFIQRPRARLTIPEGSADRATQIRAVIEVDGKNLNRELIDQGYGQYQEHLGGAEAQEMFGATGKAIGSIAEALSFQGDSTSVLNPMRYIPTPGHTKAWQERTPLDQYLSNEVIGTRMRRWERPIHDFLPGLSVLPPPKHLTRPRGQGRPCSPTAALASIAVLEPRSEYASRVRCRIFSVPLPEPSPVRPDPPQKMPVRLLVTAW